MTQLIYKILSATEWQEAEREGVFKGAGIDINDGFIHFSTAEQAAETAAKISQARRDWWWSPSMRRSWGRRSNGKCRAADSFSRISMRASQRVTSLG